MGSSTVETLINLAAARFGASASEIQPDDDMFDKLGIDSFQAAEMMSEVEIEFDVEIPDYELQGIKTFAALAEKIDRRR